MMPVLGFLTQQRFNRCRDKGTYTLRWHPQDVDYMGNFDGLYDYWRAKHFYVFVTCTLRQGNGANTR